MCEVNSTDFLLFPAFAELRLVIQKREFLNDVVHDEVGVNGRFTG